ncbi:MAG: response regulator [Acidobacteriota bacterium]|nr:response regulator [Acidobacteriota bacterium]
MSEQHRQILVVDDDPAVRQILATALRQLNMVVDEAAEGRTAIQLLSENHYSVVLLDLLMPDVDGFGVLDAIDGASAQPPIVLVVTGADHSIVERLDARRIHGIVRKPFDAAEIAQVVAACAEIRSRSAFEKMAIATMISSAPLIAFLKL